MHLVGINEVIAGGIKQLQLLQKLHAHSSCKNHCIVPRYMGMFLNINSN